MAKLLDDKYYTPSHIVDKCISNFLSVARENGWKFSEIIEPSAGNGAFSNKIPNCIAYDIKPESNSIIQADFLELSLEYKKDRVIIGNPPFGTRNSLSIKFYNKSCEVSDYIAFIQPISQLNNNLQMYLFDLVSSIDLGVQHYTDRDLHCCFNIYARPKNGLNPKPDFTLKDITIIEHRRKKGEYQTGTNKHIDLNYDYAMCNWGNGSLGKQPKFIGEYAQEVYFYCHNKKYLNKMLELLEFNKIREFTSSISAKKISVMRLYKYLKDNIEGVE